MENKYPGTVKFFIVLEKDKPYRVLPALHNHEVMTDDDIEKLSLISVLSGRIIIPDIEPWNQISKDAQQFFLMIQTRDDWGAELNETKLLHVESIQKITKELEESLNSGKFHSDIRTGRFSHRNSNAFEKPISGGSSKSTSDEIEAHAGSSWETF